MEISSTAFDASGDRENFPFLSDQDGVPSQFMV